MNKRIPIILHLLPLLLPPRLIQPLHVLPTEVLERLAKHLELLRLSPRVSRRSNDEDPLLLHPIENDLPVRHVLLVSDLAHDVVHCSSRLFHQRRESGVGGGNDPVLLRLLNRRRLGDSVVRVISDLVDGGENAGVGEEGGEVRFVVVGDSDRADQSLVNEALESSPDALGVVCCERREVDEVLILRECQRKLTEMRNGLTR
jgi:hypothetical protein